jgi:regulation of enolase protein 1 (concanavalin A-like superfamily)
LFEVDGSLTIKSRAARDLWSFFVSAPRMMRPIKDDFITQVTGEPASTDRPGVGGILLWQDKSNYLRLSIGVRAQDETSLDGCIANRDVVIGRGRLATGPITLRMERSGNTVRALCRAVDQEWFGVGKIEFPASGPLQVGLVAIGFTDRIIYQAPYPDGTAIRFTDFLLWS